MMDDSTGSARPSNGAMRAFARDSKVADPQGVAKTLEGAGVRTIQQLASTTIQSLVQFGVPEPSAQLLHAELRRRTRFVHYRQYRDAIFEPHDLLPLLGAALLASAGLAVHRFGGVPWLGHYVNLLVLASTLVAVYYAFALRVPGGRPHRWMSVGVAVLVGFAGVHFVYTRSGGCSGPDSHILHALPWLAFVTMWVLDALRYRHPLNFRTQAIDILAPTLGLVAIASCVLSALSVADEAMSSGHEPRPSVVLGWSLAVVAAAVAGRAGWSLFQRRADIGKVPLYIVSSCGVGAIGFLLVGRSPAIHAVATGEAPAAVVLLAVLSLWCCLLAYALAPRSVARWPLVAGAWASLGVPAVQLVGALGSTTGLASVGFAAPVALLYSRA